MLKLFVPEAVAQKPRDDERWIKKVINGNLSLSVNCSDLTNEHKSKGFVCMAPFSYQGRKRKPWTVFNVGAGAFWQQYVWV